jgi:hypothetical protein
MVIASMLARASAVSGTLMNSARRGLMGASQEFEPLRVLTGELESRQADVRFHLNHRRNLAALVPLFPWAGSDAALGAVTARTDRIHQEAKPQCVARRTSARRATAMRRSWLEP